MQSKAATIAKYVAELPPERRSVIKALDKIVRTAAPDAVASMRYGMPTYDLKSRFVAFNAQRNYFSFYADPEVVERHRAELKGLDCGKSCIRFRKAADVSLATLGRIARASLK
ncbi:MAG TPA: DUF1801 domain-containing protein [Opitutaceae bacterium]|nr:DUF1801 domain-containing protein [Opitutaceae bacterium]